MCFVPVLPDAYCKVQRASVVYVSCGVPWFLMWVLCVEERGSGVCVVRNGVCIVRNAVCTLGFRVCLWGCRARTCVFLSVARLSGAQASVNRACTDHGLLCHTCEACVLFGCAVLFWNGATVPLARAQPAAAIPFYASLLQATLGGWGGRQALLRSDGGGCRPGGCGATHAGLCCRCLPLSLSPSVPTAAPAQPRALRHRPFQQGPNGYNGWRL